MAGAGTEFVESLENALLGTLRLGRHRVGFVVEGEVVKKVLALREHAPEPVGDNYGDLISERGIVSEQRGVRAREHVTMTVLMLETFPIERRAACGRAGEKTARLRIARRPRQV